MKRVSPVNVFRFKSYVLSLKSSISTMNHWEQQQPLFDRIQGSGMQTYVSSIPDISEAFILSDRSIRCMDEGTPGGIHAAGSGILMTDEELTAFLDRARPDGAYSHGACGACGLYAKDAASHEDDPDANGPEWCEKLQREHGIPYKGHIQKEDMARPADLHIARCAYYDDTGVFDGSRVASFPKGFVISRAYLSAAYAQKEATIACRIAFGHHGFGDLFTVDQPFRLIAIAGSEARLAELKKELDTVATEFAGRVVVDGFVR